VTFWQTSHVGGGTGGSCAVGFGVYGDALASPVEGLTPEIRTIDGRGRHLGLAPARLDVPRGPRVDRSRELWCAGPARWPGQDDGEPSPLCHEGTTLVAESARGRQRGQPADLVRHRQLGFTTVRKTRARVSP
jgi:hypothetical protein